MTMTVNRDLALIGAGHWGRNLARNFHELGALRTICDIDPGTLASYATGYEQVSKTGDLSVVLQDPAIDKVVIATPPARHAAIAAAALAAGKDVYVEKPLTLDIEDARTLLALAEARQRILMVGHLLHYHPCVREIQRLLAGGELGRLLYITSNRLNLGRFRSEENALWSFAPHDISVILALVGQLPEQVRCLGESFLTPGVADTTLTTLRFAGGVRAHVYVTWLNPFKEQKLTVVGSTGMLVFDDTKPWAEKLALYRDYVTWTDGRTPTSARPEPIPVVVAEREPLRDACQHFLECCATRVSPRTDGAEGLRVLQVLMAAQGSLERDGEATTAAVPAVPPVSAAPPYFAHPTAVIDPAATVGAGSHVWHFSHVMKDATIGKGCNLGQNVVVSPGVRLGDNVKVQNNVSIYTGTIVEDDVFFGPSCVLTNVSNPRSQVSRRGLYEQTRVRRGATVGANATIVCGTTLGRYCFIAAGAVVTGDVPDYALVVGCPGRQVGWMSRHGHRLHADPDGLMVCPESGLTYREVAPGVVRCLDLDEERPLPDSSAVGTIAYRDVVRAGR